MREEKDKDTKKTNSVQIEVNEVTKLISSVKIKNNNIASSKRDIAKTKKESDVKLKEKKIRNSKRQITKARFARLINKQKELKTLLAKNTQEIKHTKQELNK